MFTNYIIKLNAKTSQIYHRNIPFKSIFNILVKTKYSLVNFTTLYYQQTSLTHIVYYDNIRF